MKPICAIRPVSGRAAIHTLTATLFVAALATLSACTVNDGRPNASTSGAAHDTPPAAAVTESEWNGFTRRDFVVAGRPALLIVPDEPAPGNPWVWRAEWFGNRHGPQVQLALLDRGWHVGYINAKDMFGGPEAMDIFEAFYDHVTSVYGLSGRFVMEGFSRGGLYTVNYAAEHPDQIAGLYLDAPALDLRSWPGRRHPGWPVMLEAYGIADDETSIDRVNPIGRVGDLIEAEIPVIGVSGDDDTIVPFSANLALFEQQYRAAGGVIEVIVKPGAGHSPHSLEDPTPIVDFLLQNARF